jgi:hypothetical protein
MVTLQERQKAEKIMASYQGGKKDKKPRGPPVDPATKGFSKGEKDLYREINKLTL